MARKRTRTSVGRRKIEIKPILDEQARHVCFSKRRIGVFTKACDLSTLCGANTAIVLYSPSGNPYSFGSPTVDQVIDRFLTGDSSPDVTGPSEVVQHLNREIMQLTNKIVDAKAKKAVLEERFKATAAQVPEGWWVEKVEGLGLPELEGLKQSLDRLKFRADERVVELLGRGGGSTSDSVLAANPVRAFNPFELGAFQDNPMGNTGFNGF